MIHLSLVIWSFEEVSWVVVESLSSANFHNLKKNNTLDSLLLLYSTLLSTVGRGSIMAHCS